jgi:hypothetical protein
MKWTGSTPLYIYESPDQYGVMSAKISTNYDDFSEVTDKSHIKEFSYG